MLALVTGATGFVGRHLVSHLEHEGDRVLGIDRDHGVDIVDSAAVSEVLARHRPEVVYHLAAWSDVGGSWSAPLDTFRANAVGTLNVLQACSETGVGRVILVSSADIYGVVSEADLPIDEEALLRPVSPYAVSKVAADFLGLQAWLGHKLEVLRVRAFNHLGPGQSDRFVAAALAHRVARAEASGTNIVSVGDLTPRRDFTDVRDVVRAYRLLALRGEPGTAYNVCSGRDVAIAELAELMLAMSDQPLRLELDPSLQRPVEVPVLRGDSSRLRRATAWAPEWSLNDTLADVLADWRTRVRGESR